MTCHVLGWWDFFWLCVLCTYVFFKGREYERASKGGE